MAAWPAAILCRHHPSAPERARRGSGLAFLGPPVSNRLAFFIQGLRPYATLVATPGIVAARFRPADENVAAWPAVILCRHRCSAPARGRRICGFALAFLGPPVFNRLAFFMQCTTPRGLRGAIAASQLAFAGICRTLLALS